MSEFIHIVGGGLAGSEAAWQLAEAGGPVSTLMLYPRQAADGNFDRRDSASGDAKWS